MTTLLGHKSEFKITIIKEIKNMTNESFEIIQENKLGSQSTQIAQQNNYYGMDYQNTKSLCQDLIKNELEKYKSDAEQLAKERNEKFLSTLFEKLHKEKIDDNSMCEEFKNPDNTLFSKRRKHIFDLALQNWKTFCQIF